MCVSFRFKKLKISTVCVYNDSQVDIPLHLKNIYCLQNSTLELLKKRNRQSGNCLDKVFYVAGDKQNILQRLLNSFESKKSEFSYRAKLFCVTVTFIPLSLKLRVPGTEVLSEHLRTSVV